MAKPKAHKPGVKIYDSVVAQLPDLLKELLAAPAAKVSEHPPIPEAPGIYLFSEPGGAGGGADKAIYVGQTRKLRSRLKNHTRLGGKNNQATFAFLLAKTDAEAAGVDTKQYREILEQDEDFIAHFDGAKSRVAEILITRRSQVRILPKKMQPPMYIRPRHRRIVAEDAATPYTLPREALGPTTFGGDQ